MASSRGSSNRNVQQQQLQQLQQQRRRQRLRWSGFGIHGRRCSMSQPPALPAGSGGGQGHVSVGSLRRCQHRRLLSDCECGRQHMQTTARL